MKQPPAFNLPDYIEAQRSFFRTATQHLAFGKGKEILSTAAEWLPDNSYLVQQTCREIVEDMPPGFYRQLPRADTGQLAAFPRIYAIAQRLVATSRAQLDMARVERFVCLYQDIGQLTMGELWALPVMLRLTLVELLALAVSRITSLPRTETVPLPSWHAALSDDELVAHCILSLRVLATQDWQEFFESVSGVERTLRQDPAQVYARMDRTTRDRYRKVIETLARETGKDELSVARAAIDLARGQTAPRTGHVGYYLLEAGRAVLEAQLGYRVPLRARVGRWALSHPTLVYLGGIGLIALSLLLAGILYAARAGANPWQWVVVGLLLLIPVLTVSVSLVNWIVSIAVPPRVLAKMDYEDGIPSDYRTLVVIPSLLSNASEVQSLLRQLELHYLRSQDSHLYFALLTDLPDTAEPLTSEDHPLVQQAVAGIQALNDKYPRESSSPFYLFHRDPKWNPSEERWMGWERKRGKLHQLNLLLRGRGRNAFSVQTGDLAVLPKMRFVITLDADTLMPREAASRLVATLAHPLNHAEFDPESGAVIAGYTLLQPGIEITATSVTRSRFTRIFAGDVGLDLYSRAVSNAYQDLFGEGIYVGKGIYDIDAFERSLAGRMPENTLLSHDLIEGIHGRVGLVTDIVLYEDYPPHYFVYQRRSQRWIRGDWQLLPWLSPRVPAVGNKTIPNDLSVIARWKIVDNLRRSLLAPALLVLLIAGWLGLPGSPLVWTLAGFVTPAVPVLTGLVSDLIRAAKGNPWRSVLRALQTGLVRWALALIFILFETAITLGSIATTVFRLFVTRKGLLEWTSYARTVRDSASRVTLAQVLATVFTLAVLVALIIRLNPSGLVPAAPLLIAWLFSPAIAYWISRPSRRAPEPLSAADRQKLRNAARRTWFFFEQFVGPDDHWLPPDHFQQAPRGIIAHSTSPTNIGLFLLATVGAHDLGYIGLENLVVRVRSTLESTQGLEKYQGHLLNWYDTRTLEPLTPRYVSTVDSGNLVACLRTLAQACQSLLQQPVLRWASWEGLIDTLSVLDDVAKELEPKMSVPLRAHLDRMRDQVQAAEGAPENWVPLLDQLMGTGWKELYQLLSGLVQPGTNVDTETWHRLSPAAERVRYHLYGMRQEIEHLAPWLLAANQPPQSVERADTWPPLRQILSTPPLLAEMKRFTDDASARLAVLQEQLQVMPAPPREIELARDWCTHLAQALAGAAAAAEGLGTDIQNLIGQAKCQYEAMQFEFLFDPQRQLFHIGYNVTAERLDNNYYDLLASEARIASFVTIAEDQVPPSHWVHLGRPLTQVDGTRALLSWGGTMFEYLMPSLLMRSYEGTLLQQSCLAAVDYQIAYGGDHNAPWGISESGYKAFDANENYQYRTFGVPGLGFKRDLGEDLVIAPYASLLALSVHPRAVVENIARLDMLGMLGMEGFYESVDMTPARLAPGETHAIVRSYMAHHQGMILLSLVNYLHDDVMVRRFHADPLIKSAELLLQEKVPLDAPLDSTLSEDAHTTRHDPSPVPTIAAPWPVSLETAMPQAHLLSNGRYSVLITGAGAGYSSWERVDLTRWRADTTREDWGSWVYVQDKESGALWSAAFQPTGVRPASQQVQFYPHMAEFRRSDHGIGLTMEVAVAPAEDVEIRRISLTNYTDRVRPIELTSYGEIILSPQAEDARHPAFNKMFVESEYLSALNALLFHRRLRSTTEEPLFLGHLALVSPGHSITGAHEADRGRFLGRGCTTRAPGALSGQGDGMSGTTGATLDPLMSLGQTVELEPHASAQVSFITVVSASREKTLELVRRYQEPRIVDLAFAQARTYAESELTKQDLTGTELEQFDQLLSVLLYPHAVLRARAATLAANRRGQSGLWAFGISGDYPILLVQMDKTDDLALVQQVLQAHAHWRTRGIKIDLVILNRQGMTYGQELRGQLQRILVRQKSEDWFNRRGGIFILYGDQLGEPDRVLLETAARVVLDGAKGSLAHQLESLHRLPTYLPAFVPVPSESAAERTPPLDRPAGLVYDNGLGGFSADGREYVVFLKPGQWTPAPWVNVIANPDFGFTVSESGSGYTWFGNSSENRLTPWSNDPVSDPPGEALYLRDEETAEVWSPTPLPCPAPAPYLIRHGAGYSIFEHNSHGLAQRLRLFAAPDAPVKIVQLRLTNTWSQPRRITATWFTEWVLGLTRDATQQYVVSEFDTDCQALLARNSYRAEFGERVAFSAASEKLHGLTADRAEFLGRMSGPGHPAALDRIGLAGKVEPGLDPCAALQVHMDLKPGETREIFFLLGEGADRAEALKLVEQYRDAKQVEAAWNQVNAFWDKLLGAVQVHTPEPAMDLMLNRWLLYPLLSCRVWGRSAFYQSSGAFGFRDQLQDVLALVHTAPHLTRAQILQSAQYQFQAGDVLHWWHPPSGRGVRTRSSDDLLWLPFATAAYVTATGDQAVLDETIPFLQAAPLAAGELDRYGLYPATAEAYTLYEHCRRALNKGITAGAHGLPLMGSGDWNDGMNRVGIDGRGESVWVGWFLSATLTRFAEICVGRGDAEQAAIYSGRARALNQAIESSAWDGAWYLRAFYDDGAPLGSAASDECQMDSIAQSWAILSGAGDPTRAAQALESAAARLVRTDDQLLLLLEPPFDQTPRDPGYIKGYPPGVRENGGQYTHGAMWMIWAFAQLGQGERAESLFRMLNPIHHGDTPDKAARYRVEPYVVAADVYSALPYAGRGGWTWYTGSNGWMYRLGLEAILGIRRAGEKLEIDPCIPGTWKNYEVVYSAGAARYDIRVENPAGVQRGIKQVTLDGRVITGNAIPLSDDGRVHVVNVLMG